MINWIVTNWEICLGILSALVVLAGAIVKLTPSKKDDEIVEKIKTIVDKIPPSIKK